MKVDGRGEEWPRSLLKNQQAPRAVNPEERRWSGAVEAAASGFLRGKVVCPHVARARAHGCSHWSKVQR